MPLFGGIVRYGCGWDRVMTHVLGHAGFPVRELELASHMSRLHGGVRHSLSASECETMGVGELLALGDGDDLARWEGLRLGYTEPLGASWLREAAASGYAGVGAGNLVCFAGAQEALYAAVHALLGAGDHAVVVVPGYQSMETLALGVCAVTGVALDAGDGWSLDVRAVAGAMRGNTRVVVISFPNNPTGRVLERERFEALVGLCRERGVWLLSDEVYRLTEREVGRRLPAAVEAYERGVSLGVLSKAYGLPGLRVGWVACRDAGLMGRVATIRQYLSTCNAGPSEVLACIALKAGGRVIGRNLALAAANWSLLAGFFARHAGVFDCVAPEGGVVCYPRYRGAEGVEAFVARMAAEASVSLLPASVFRSELVALPGDRFRIGFGGLGFAAGLAALEGALG